MQTSLSKEEDRTTSADFGPRGLIVKFTDGGAPRMENLNVMSSSSLALNQVTFDPKNQRENKVFSFLLFQVPNMKWKCSSIVHINACLKTVRTMAQNNRGQQILTFSNKKQLKSRI